MTRCGSKWNTIFKGFRRVLIILALFIAFFYKISLGGQWINPKEVIGDPSLARLQQGRKELTPTEKRDLEKYGFTGLEIITYVDVNREPGKEDSEGFYHLTKVVGGSIELIEDLRRRKYYRKSYRDYLTPNGIKPGEIRAKRSGMVLYPPKMLGTIWIGNIFLWSENYTQFEEQWVRFPWLLRPRRYTSQPGESKWTGSEMLEDDRRKRHPRQEDHRILGEDVINGHACFVIESIHKYNPNYPYSKRVSWIDREVFIDLHEEQFDRQGRLFKVVENKWAQMPPGNYWVRTWWDYYNLESRNRAILETFEWVFDQGLKDEDFGKGFLNRVVPWRKPKNPLPIYKRVSDLPPPPQVRWEFWDKLGLKVTTP